MKRKRTHKNCKFAKKVRKDNKKYYSFDGIRCINEDACEKWIVTSGACYLHRFAFDKTKPFKRVWISTCPCMEKCDSGYWKLIYSKHRKLNSHGLRELKGENNPVFQKLKDKGLIDESYVAMDKVSEICDKAAKRINSTFTSRPSYYTEWIRGKTGYL